MDRFTAHLDRAWDLVSKADTTKALISARRALEIDKESPEVHNLVGYIHAMDGEVEDALVSYRQAMVLDDTYVDPILNSAELLVHPDGNPEEAIELLRSVAGSLDGETAVEAILLEVEAHLNLGSIIDAKARLGDIENPETLPLNYAVFVGRALFETGEVKRARPYFERAIGGNLDSADAWYYLGLIAREEGRRIDSVKAFIATLKADEKLPDPPWAKHLEPFDSLVEKALERLDESGRAALSGTEIILVEAPTGQQIQNELDPRQVLFAEGIDLERSAFEKLWVFTRNIARVGVLPQSAEEELAVLIQNEIRMENPNS